MRTILHLVTKPQDDLTREVMANQRTLPETRVEVVDISEGAADYGAVVEAIFAADSIHVW